MTSITVISQKNHPKELEAFTRTFCETHSKESTRGKLYMVKITFFKCVLKNFEIFANGNLENAI
jgi:hypothetical protein